MKTIFGIEVRPGEKHYGQIPVGELAHKGVVQIPVMILSSGEGPTLWINGAVHGAELNGSLAAWRLFQSLSPEEVKGTLIITPIANALGFQRRDKISDLDFQDMDTAFPGRPDGTFTERIAYAIYREISAVRPDCVLSFHTMGPYWSAVHYTVSKIVPDASDEVIERSFALALSFGLETNCHFDLKTASGELPGATSGALDIICMQDGIPCFMAEMGGGGRLQEENVQTAQQGIRNTMMYLGMLPGVPQAPTRRRIITRRTFLRCDCGGLVEMAVRPGDTLKRGEIQCGIHYFGERVTECPVLADAYFIGVRFNPVVSTGDPVSFVGTEWYLTGEGEA